MASDPQQAAGQSTSSDPQKIPIRCPIPPEHRKQFTKIVKECNEESFWNRALPLSITSMIATQALIYTGYLSKNKRFGSLPKVALAGILGFAVGKISYALTCNVRISVRNAKRNVPWTRCRAPNPLLSPPEPLLPQLI
ncbi:hypothetical protein GDO81_000328 [Engystomops pustulosus]|uniref:OCIA domain-containing protein n=1 Tax=Engystomops pustulosus TaxID=76066 RepID=A0AAV7D3V9_ENGPU|nr:hypothetical protein GDO81_000328 [Engystomops pustulosus]